MNWIELRERRFWCGVGCAAVLGLLAWHHHAEAQGYVTIRALNTGGARGTRVTLSVAAATGGLPVAGVQNDIVYSGATPIAATSAGKPDCTVNPNISSSGKMTLSTAFQPSGCSGSKCTSLRAIVVPEGMNSFTIPDGAILYTCRVNIAATAAVGTYPIGIAAPGASDGGGLQLATVGANGSVSVIR